MEPPSENSASGQAGKNRYLVLLLALVTLSLLLSVMVSGFTRDLFVDIAFILLLTAAIQPISRPARSPTWMQAMAGRLFGTILVSRLVGLQISQAQHRRDR